MGANINIKGFRPGKAPPSALLERIDPERLLEETVRILMRASLPALFTEHKLLPLLPPRVEAVSRNPLTLAVTVVQRPPVTWKKRHDLRVEKKEIAADAKDVDRVLTQLLRPHEKATPVDRAAQTGDRVTVDFRGLLDDGTAIEGMTASNYAVDLGGNRLIPGFEEQIVGQRAGEERTVRVTFPTEYHSEPLRGKPASFAVRLHQVSTIERPELTDDFAQKHLGAPTAAAVRERITASLRSQEEQWDRMRREAELLKKIAAAIDVELADELIDDEARALITDRAEHLKEQGVTLEQWLQQEKKDSKAFMKEIRDEASERLRVRLGIEDLLVSRAVAVPDADVDKALEQHLAQVPEERRNEARGDMRMRIAHNMKVDALIEQLLATEH
ncbi:MAG: trigger factor [Candidatus Peregrinibacteria bacterium Gr01-1014_25]|nr:MAG: trigger factor [Candidatus Peregrinibacteria bacterium Gr01-1014_25]